MVNENNFHIEFPMFGDYMIAVVFTDDIAASRIDRDDEIGNKFEGNATALHSYNNKTDDGIAWLFFFRDVTPGVIAHEATHAVSRILEYLGVTNYDQEIYAYLVEYVVEQVWKFQQEVEKEKEQWLSEELNKSLLHQSLRVCS